jgi:hypothetical protein
MEKARTQVLLAVPQLITLAQSQSVDPAAIDRLTASKAKADLLAPLLTEFEAVARVLGDAVLGHRRDESVEARSIYAQLKGKAKGNPTLVAKLAPLDTAFRIPRRAPAKDATTKSTPETAAVGEAAAATTGAATHG